MSCVEKEIHDGTLAPGERLPTVRSLSRELGLSHGTVAAAYGRLRQRGLVTGNRRAGTRVAARPPFPVRTDAPLPPGVCDVSDGNPDARLLPSIPAVPPEHALYGTAPIEPALEQLECERFAADGVATEGLWLASGALDAVERALTAHLRPGDGVAVEDPGFPRLHDLVRAMGMNPRPVAMDPRGPVPEALDTAVAAGARAVLLTPRAQNPTGAAFDGERAAELRAVLDRHQEVFVVEDDHAAEIAGTPLFSVTAERERWALVRSYSKAFGPDLRLAAVASDSLTAARVKGRQLLGPGWISHLLQRAFAAMLADGGTAEQLASAARAYGERRQALVEALAQRGVEAWGESGLCVWVPVSEETTTVRSLLQAGWAAAAGERFRIASGPGIRITIAQLDTERAGELAAAVADVHGRRPGTATA